MDTSASGKLTFGRLIKESRERQHLKQRHVATEAKLHFVSLCQIEHDRANPRLSTVLRLLRVLGIDPEHLGDIEETA